MGPSINFDYYVNEAIGRLYRYAPATGRQERWDENSGAWVTAAPSLADDIYAGRVELEEVTTEQAKIDSPKAFEERLPITVDTMNKIQVCIAQGSSFEDFISDYKLIEPELSAARRFHAALLEEMSENKLAPGQFWDVSAEWS